MQGCTVEIRFLYCCTSPLNRVQHIILLNTTEGFFADVVAVSRSCAGNIFPVTC